MISPVTLPCPGASIAAAAHKALPVLDTERSIPRAPVLEGFEPFAGLFSSLFGKLMSGPPDCARLVDGPEMGIGRSRDPLFKPKGWALD